MNLIGMTLQDYCLTNSQNLLSYEQECFSWKDKYDVAKLCEIQEFAEIYSDIPELIGRKDILNSIKQNKFTFAFVEILLWGQIGARPGSNKSKRTEILKIALIDALKEVNGITKMQHIFEIVSSNNYKLIHTLYISLERGGEYKIREIDTSYFTKILSFASEAFGNDLKLLIYDKWTRLLHVHYLLDLKDDSVRMFYSKSSLVGLCSMSRNSRSIATKIIFPRTNFGASAYFDYCQKLLDLSTLVSVQLGKQISSFHLEGYLFGKELKSVRNRTFDNPRFWLQHNYVISHRPYLL